MKVLFVSSEMSPLAKSGGLGDVLAALPRALRAQGQDVRVILPLYKKIKNQFREKLEFRRWSMLKMGWRTMYSGLFSMTYEGVPCYFIDNEYYFGHDALYVNYDFDIERFAFFQRAVLEAMGEAMDFEPDILHVHDWQGAMIPLLLELHYKTQGYHLNVQTVLTLHNLHFQGIHGCERIQDLFDLSEAYLSEDTLVKDHAANFLKAGIAFSKRITTVSPTYAKEILSDFYGEGLSAFLLRHQGKMKGILNGIDEQAYNPARDPEIFNYSLSNYEKGKTQNKLRCQTDLGLTQSAKMPLLAMISRLSEQKGLDLFLHIADELLQQDLQIIVLGTGEGRYEEALRQLEKRHPERMRALIEFSEAKSRLLYAASDFLMMPSIFEPCGLSQLIAMRYGSLPVVRETGGLKDTVQAYNEYEQSGNGYSFTNINAHELLYTCKYALETYRQHPAAHRAMVHRAMQQDYSWQQSAAAYLALYQELCPNA